MAAAATAPAMTNEEAMRIAQENGAITHEQVVMAAMLGKMINGGLTDIKKQAVGDGLKVGAVDMSKVMPSGIAKAMGKQLVQPPQPPQQALPPQAPLEVPEVPGLFPAVDIQPPIPIMQMPMVQPPKPEPSGQLELDFEKKARYEDIYKKLEELEDRIIALSQNVNKILELADKKKLKKTQLDGTQTG